MKTTKLFIALIFIIFFSGVLHASGPSKEGVDNKAGVLVERLSKDIVLTNRQKKEITEKAKIFMTDVEKVKNSTDNEEKKLAREKSGKVYNMALDSILTNEQKEQLLVKQNERKEALIKRYQTQQ